MVIDLHVDTLLRLVEKGGEFRGPRPDLQVDIPRAREGGVRLLLCACFTEDGHPTPAANVDAMLARAAELHADPETPLRRVTHPSEVARLRDDELGFLLTIENALALEEDLERLDTWHESGVRVVGITWNAANPVASGVLAPEDTGLTPWGREVIRRAGRLGMAIDLSHLAPRGVTDVLAEDVPVLATHSNARALHDHPRNLTDAQLDALAERGGVVGLNFYPNFLGSDAVDLDTVARHARHIADRIGADRVAIGTDLDGIPEGPKGFRGHQDLPRVSAALERAGFSATEIRGIFSENFLGFWERWAS